MTATTRSKPADAPRGISVHVGLNTVNPQHYGGWQSQLTAAEADAAAMAKIATANGMATKVLLSADATRTKVLTAIRAAAKTLKAGDLFFLSFSGCGGQIPNYVDDEEDRLGETLCLYDAQLIDVELIVELRKFAAGTRLLVVQDTSHSGTVTRALPVTLTNYGARIKLAPVAVVMQTYREHKAFYDKLQLDASRALSKSKDPGPAILTIMAAQENQTAVESAGNGLFTKTLLEVWDDGRFTGHYNALLQRVRMRMPPTQSPIMTTIGSVTAFASERPFSVAGTPARR